MFEDAEVSSYVGGIGVHWYEDEIYPISALSHTHERHPDKFILATEVSNSHEIDSILQNMFIFEIHLILILGIEWLVEGARKGRASWLLLPGRAICEFHHNGMSSLWHSRIPN